MGALISLVAVAVLALLARSGRSPATACGSCSGSIIPGVAFAVFLGGIIYRVVRWAQVAGAVPDPDHLRAAKSLPWIRNNELESPSGLLGRHRADGPRGPVLPVAVPQHAGSSCSPTRQKVNYIADKYLWAAALAFHWAILIILLRHLRFFVEPVPAWVEIAAERSTASSRSALPVYLRHHRPDGGRPRRTCWSRRLFDAKVRYISLPADYFALFLLLGIAITGILMRHVEKVDVVAGQGSDRRVGLVPAGAAGRASVCAFFVHLFLVSVLFVYFPFSKLMHAPGVFLSPTRNLANNNRARRHVNPWNPDVEGHTYEEWEDEFRDKMKAAGYALEKE